jgi:uncharacterized protein YbjT (DUF2867 family)
VQAREVGALAIVFVTGGTGYLGRELIPRLLERGHQVRALARPGSERKLPPGALPVVGNALDGSTFAGAVKPADTFVQLVGVAHPSPAKASQFRTIDLVSARESVLAAVKAGARHFVYVSVAQPAPVMKAYQGARAEGEQTLRDSGLAATVIRPWYVLGPGHQWARALLPVYWLLERWPSTRQTARRLALVTLTQMTAALVCAVEQPATGFRIVEVPEIRRSAIPSPRRGEGQG